MFLTHGAAPGPDDACEHKGNLDLVIEAIEAIVFAKDKHFPPDGFILTHRSCVVCSLDRTADGVSLAAATRPVVACNARTERPTLAKSILLPIDPTMKR